MNQADFKGSTRESGLSDRLCSFSVIKAQETTDAFVAHDLSCGDFRAVVRKGNDVADPLVISFRMEMFNVIFENVAQGLFSEQNHLVQAFVFYGSDPTLGDSVEVGAGWREFEGTDSFRSENVIEGFCEFGIAVVKEKFRALESAVRGQKELAVESCRLAVQGGPVKKTCRDLVVWQRAVDLAPSIYSLLKRFPREETYALGSQVRRAVVSIAANIAEGQARNHRKEFVQHLMIAKGSLAELETLLIIAGRLGYLSKAELAEPEVQMQAVAKLLNGLLNKLEGAANCQPPTVNS